MSKQIKALKEIRTKYSHLFDVWIETERELVKIHDDFKPMGYGENDRLSITLSINLSREEVSIIGFKEKTKEIEFVKNKDSSAMAWRSTDCLEVMRKPARIWTNDDIKNGYHSSDEKFTKNLK